MRLARRSRHGTGTFDPEHTFRHTTRTERASRRFERNGAHGT